MSDRDKPPTPCHDPQDRSQAPPHALRVLAGAWIVARLDGRGFSRFTGARFEKPFDEAYHGHMATTAQPVLEEMQGLYAYTESDEISVLFPRGWDFFEREVEKIVSISASVASATFSLSIGEPVQFDSRIWMAPAEEDVVDNFRWRQADAARCALNRWCYWTLRKGAPPRRPPTRICAGRLDERAPLPPRHQLQRPPHLAAPRHGPLLRGVREEGLRPKRQVEVTVTRRRVKLDRELPTKEDYSRFIAKAVFSQ
jgi:tRNA(His) 5'-end guanylyltransferase